MEELFQQCPSEMVCATGHLRVMPRSPNQNPGQTNQSPEDTIILRRSLRNEEGSGEEQTPLLFGPEVRTGIDDSIQCMYCNVMYILMYVMYVYI